MHIFLSTYDINKHFCCVWLLLLLCLYHTFVCCCYINVIKCKQQPTNIDVRVVISSYAYATNCFCIHCHEVQSFQNTHTHTYIHTKTNKRSKSLSSSSSCVWCVKVCESIKSCVVTCFCFLFEGHIFFSQFLSSGLLLPLIKV